MFKTFLIMFLKISLALISSLIFLVIAEALARQRYKPQEIIFEGLFEYDKDKSFRLKKNYTDTFGGKEVLTNSYHYRDDEIPLVKEANEWRVVMLGDSVTFGHGVDAIDTYSEKYQASLSAEFANKKITVLNTGVPGYGPMQQYVDFERTLEFKPNAVVMQFTLNDITEPFVFQTRLGGSGIDYHNVQDMSYWHFYLSQRSGLYLFLMDIAKFIRFGTTDDQTVQSQSQRFQSLTDRQLVFDLEDNRQNIQWNEYFVWVQKYIDSCKKIDMSCYLLLSPYTFQLELDNTFDHPQQRIKNFAAQNNIIAIDLLPTFRELIKKELIIKYELPKETDYKYLIDNYLPDVQNEYKKYFIDIDHYTPLGHEMVSAELLKFVIKPNLQ